MSAGEPQFQLPDEIEQYLGTLSKHYGRQGERRKQEIIVNSQVRIEEGASYDNWDGGIYGHAVYLTVPENLYLNLLKKRRDLQNEIRDDLNKIHNVHKEFISDVFLEMEKVKDRDWRRESGVLLSRQRVITLTAADRIWGQGGYRVFLSHKAEVKKKAGDLKGSLSALGVSSFVAHTDIHPTKEWQDEIENALASMDAFVALLTEKFHDSDWTDQEVGYALGRGVPLIAVKLGRAPYGFIGRFQALSTTWDDAPIELAKLLMKQPRMLDSYISAMPRCGSFDEANMLAKLFPFVEKMTIDQAEQMVAAFNKNTQLQGAYGFTGEKPHMYGAGLAAHLSRMTGEKFVRTSSGEIKMKKK
jgi:TIR domain